MSDPIEMAPMLGPTGNSWILETFTTTNIANIFYGGYGYCEGLVPISGAPPEDATQAHRTVRIHDDIDRHAIPNRSYFQSGKSSPQHDYIVALRTATAAGTMADIYRSSDLSFVTSLTGAGFTSSSASKVCWSKDGKFMAIPDRNRAFSLYRCPEFTLHSQPNGSGITGWDVSIGGDKIAYMSGASVIVNQITEAGLVPVTSKTASSGRKVAVHPSGLFFAATVTSTAIAVYDMAGNAIGTNRVFGSGTFTALEFSPCGTYLYAANSALTGLSEAWFSGPNWEEAPSPLDLGTLGSVKDAYFSPCGNFFIRMAKYCTVHSWKTKARITPNLSMGQSSGTGIMFGKYGSSVSNEDGLPVRDADGNPVEGVKVHRLTRNPTAQTMPTSPYVITDENGRFWMPALSRSLETFVVFEGKYAHENSVIIDRVKAK